MFFFLSPPAPVPEVMLARGSLVSGEAAIFKKIFPHVSFLRSNSSSIVRDVMQAKRGSLVSGDRRHVGFWLFLRIFVQAHQLQQRM
jgi:hypothetical protein